MAASMLYPILETFLNGICLSNWWVVNHIRYNFQECQPFSSWFECAKRDRTHVVKHASYIVVAHTHWKVADGNFVKCVLLERFSDRDQYIHIPNSATQTDHLVSIVCIWNIRESTRVWEWFIATELQQLDTWKVMIPQLQGSTLGVCLIAIVPKSDLNQYDNSLMNTDLS